MSHIEYKVIGIRISINKQVDIYQTLNKGDDIAINEYFKGLKNGFDNDELIKNKGIYITCVPSSSRCNVGKDLMKLIDIYYYRMKSHDIKEIINLIPRILKYYVPSYIFYNR